MAKNKVLVVDDEEAICKLVTRALTIQGYEVAAATSGQAAIDAFKAEESSDHPFDAIIMDLTLPGGMNGIEAAEQILAIRPATPIIASSGYSTSQAIAEFKSHGFIDVVTKPYKVAELGGAVAKAIETGSQA